MKTILSIDGGGIRGIIPSILLAEIEKYTKKPIAALFDLIAGTSTGGIIALGLTKPNHHGKPEYTAEDLVELYEKHGEDIFHKSLFRQINSLGYLLEEKYPPEGLKRTLAHYFKNTYLKDALTHVMVTSYEIERRHAFFFKSWQAQKYKNRNFLMKDAARATSAAPTYFEPEKIPTEDYEEYFALIDGGVIANNPALCAFVEAKVLFPDEKEFLVVSLGTGELTKPIFYHQAATWGLAQWAQPIFDVVLSGASDTVDYQLKQLLPMEKGLKKYYRFQMRLDEVSNEMDNAKSLNLRALKIYAENLLRKESDTFTTLCQQLLKRR